MPEKKHLTEQELNKRHAEKMYKKKKRERKYWQQKQLKKVLLLLTPAKVRVKQQQLLE